MKTDITLSIVMPSLNVANYIKKSVTTACNQTLPDIEIICVDAGSTDGTWEILLDLAAGDKRIVPVKVNRKSYGYQVNIGIQMAKGKYIGILETDDYISERMYEELFVIAEKDKCDFVKCDYVAYWSQDDGCPYYIRRKSIQDSSLYNVSISPLDHLRLSTDDWYIWNGIYNRDFLNEYVIRFSETRGAAFQDIGFLHKTITRASRVEYIHGEPYFYCIDREGASSSKSKDLWYIYQEYHRISGEISEEIKENQFFYTRMIKSFVIACRNTDSTLLKKPAGKNYYEWFYKRITNALDLGYVEKERLPDDIREDFFVLMDSLDEYLIKRSSDKNKINSFLQEPNDSHIVIFGCGDYGSTAYRLLRRMGYKIDCFLDNDEKLWGKKINGIEILSPMSAVNIAKNTKYIIANEKHSDEIEHQIGKILNTDDFKRFKFSPYIAN